MFTLVQEHVYNCYAARTRFFVAQIRPAHCRCCRCKRLELLLVDMHCAVRQLVEPLHSQFTLRLPRAAKQPAMQLLIFTAGQAGLSLGPCLLLRNTRAFCRTSLDHSWC